MRHHICFVLGIIFAPLSFGQDDFNGPNPFLLGAPVWKCDTSSFNQDTIRVPSEHATIQAAINACTNGDLILIAQGVYNENLNANGKEFAIASEYILSCDTTDIYETVIQGGGGRGLSIGLEEHIKVIGLTFTGCSEGIYFQGNGPAAWHYDLYFSNLRLVGNSSFGIHGYLWRSGNYLLNSHIANNGSHGVQMINKGALYIGECLIENNGGHGIYNRQCGFLATHSKILDNGGDGVYSTYWGAGFTQNRCIIAGNGGDGIHSKNSGAQQVYNCTILNNGQYGLRGTVAAKNSIIFGNAGVHLVDNGGDPGSQGTSSFEYNLSEDELSGSGNIQGDPQLNDDFAPLPTSPVFLAGHPDAISIGSYSPNGSNGYGSYAIGAGMSIGAIQVNEIVSGCTDPVACNYNSEANVDDSSCAASGCMDAQACNFNANAECEGEACEYSCCPGPGCCSQGLFWDWDLSQCFPTNPADINVDGCVQLNDLLDLLSVYGDCGDEESVWQCGEPLGYQGYDYATVQIGEQCWFAENLRAQAYRDGTSILSDLTGGDWQYLTTGASAIYGESDGCEDADFFLACDPNESLIAFGRLYNWFAVGSDHGLCPSSWYVPSESEWDVLDEVLGGENLTDEALKSTFGWNSDNGTNTSGFGALPSGKRDVPGGDFKDAGSVGGWWSSTEAGVPYAWTRLLNTTASQLVPYAPNKKDGYSVRCIKNAE